MHKIRTEQVQPIMTGLTMRATKALQMDFITRHLNKLNANFLPAQRIAVGYQKKREPEVKTKEEQADGFCQFLATS